MKGINYIRDQRGNITKIVVDLAEHSDEAFEMLQKIRQKVQAQPEKQPSTTVAPPVESVDNKPKPEPQKSLADKIIATGKTYIGTPYRMGGTTRSGMDCSGFTMVTFRENGVKLPRVSRSQATVGQRIDRVSDLQPADLVFFATGAPGRISHVGIVSRIEGKEVYFLHASSSRGVMESYLSLGYWTRTYVTARRVL